MTSEIQTKLSVQVVLPNGGFKALRVLVDFGCQAVAFANHNVFGNVLSKKYESPQRRRLLQANNETPVPGGDKQIDVGIQFTGVLDGIVSLPRVPQYGVSLYLVPNLPWDMVFGHPWGYEHCVSHFTRFNFLYSHHPVHPRFCIEDFREGPRTSKPFLVKPIDGKVSCQSVWGITVPIIRDRLRPLWLRPLVANCLTVLRPRSTYPMPCPLPPWPLCRIRLVLWSSLNLLPKPLPVM